MPIGIDTAKRLSHRQPPLSLLDMYIELVERYRDTVFVQCLFDAFGKAVVYLPIILEVAVNAYIEVE